MTIIFIATVVRAKQIFLTRILQVNEGLGLLPIALIHFRFSKYIR